MLDPSIELHALRGAFTAHEARQARRLAIVLAIVSAFFVLELAGACLADSVVLQADALHLLVDVLALGVSLLAMRLAVREPTARFTFGLRRAEPVAAIFSSVLVLMTTGWIVVAAIEALRGGTPPKAGLMLVVAAGALIVNGVSAWLLHDALAHGEHGHPPSAVEASHSRPPDAGIHAAHRPAPTHRHGHSLNLRGAALHLLGDTLGAVAALIAAVVIRLGGPAAVDPVASFVVAAILVVGSVRLLRDATWVILEAAPAQVPVSTVRQAVKAVPGVASISEVHVWTLGAGHDAITVRLRSASPDRALAERIATRLRATFHAEYVTVQVDPASDGGGEVV